jgi:hypothetical protein
MLWTTIANDLSNFFVASTMSKMTPGFFTHATFVLNHGATKIVRARCHDVGNLRIQIKHELPSSIGNVRPPSVASLHDDEHATRCCQLPQQLYGGVSHDVSF